MQRVNDPAGFRPHDVRRAKMEKGRGHGLRGSGKGGRVLPAVAACGLLVAPMLCSCGESSGESGRLPGAEMAIPSDLRAMQGLWHASDTNSCVHCELNIDQYTIRLRYQKDEDAPNIKWNLAVSRIHEARNLLFFHNGSAWSYHYHLAAGEPLLEVEFHEPIQGRRIRVLLRRAAGSRA